MMARLYFSRDTFARTELTMEKVNAAEGVDCDWGGQVKIDRRGKRYLLVFPIEHDGGRDDRIRGKFCSTECMSDFHE